MIADLTDIRIAEKESLLTFWVPMATRSIPVDQNLMGLANADMRIKRSVRICLGDTTEKLVQAGKLIMQMYSQQNYRHENIIRKTPNTLTLIGYSRDEAAVGTITVAIDSLGEGLLAEKNYREEVKSLRSEGKKLCEFNGLAIDSSIRSKIFVARLFHIAMLYPWGIFGHKDLVIEVTPAHSRFYRRMLGFEQIGAERVCPRVNTTGVLLHLSLDWAHERIESVGGLGDRAVDDKTLYPYFFSKDDSALIIDRMRNFSTSPAFSKSTLRCSV